MTTAITLLSERFESPAHDGPAAYANFLAATDREQIARLRQDAFAAVQQFLRVFRAVTGST